MSVIPFDMTEQVRAQRADYLRDIGLSPKLGDPHKEPPHVPQINRNPRRHDVVAWRNDGARIDSWKHDTKESAVEFARLLPWVIYYQYAVMDGRNVVEQRSIPIPDGMALDDAGLPVKL